MSHIHRKAPFNQVINKIPLPLYFKLCMQLSQIEVLFCLVTPFRNIINNHVLHNPNRSLSSAKNQLSVALEETTLSLREEAKETI